MLYLVLGGTSSGKSAYAENITMDGISKLYVATMRPMDVECVKKVNKHRDMRRDKSFETLELYEYNKSLNLDHNYDYVLLECVSNMLANEIFINGNKQKDVVKYLVSYIYHIAEYAKNMVVVSNIITSGMDNYDNEIKKYCLALNSINKELASGFNRVIEVVCGIPIEYNNRGTV